MTLAIGDAGGPLAAQLPQGADVIALGGAPYRRMLALPGIVRGCAPDVLFCPGNHYTSIAAWTRLRLGSACPPVVAKLSNATVRGDHRAPAGAAHGAWLALHHRFVDHLVAMTPATAATAERAMRMRGRISVIANPPAPIREGAAAPLPPGPVILGVGRLVAQKRWDRLVAALAHMPPATSLVILGEGPRRPALAAQAGALGVRLHLPGHAADPLPAMAAARVVALTSDYEGVPGVLREALSVGTPVVATDSSPAIAEIVATPALGSIVARNDPAALVAALRHWLDDAAVRPQPVPQPGADSAARYLALFDRLVSRA